MIAFKPKRGKWWGIRIPARFVNGRCVEDGRLVCPRFLTEEDARLFAKADRMRALIADLAYFGDALIAKEYEAGSPTVTALVERARTLIGEP